MAPQPQQLAVVMLVLSTVWPNVKLLKPKEMNVYGVGNLILGHNLQMTGG